MITPPPGRVLCSSCKGAGKVTLNFGMAGDHDSAERICGTCSGKGHVAENRTIPTGNNPLTVLSRQYVAAAGQAYANRDDASAHAFRQAADAIDQLAASLPPLPGPVTR